MSRMSLGLLLLLFSFSGTVAGVATTNGDAIYNRNLLINEKNQFSLKSVTTYINHIPGQDACRGDPMRFCIFLFALIYLF